MSTAGPKHRTRVARRRLERARRALARVVVPLSRDQKRHDPTVHRKLPTMERVAWLAAIIVASAAAHGAIIGGGAAVSWLVAKPGVDEPEPGPVKVEVRNKPEPKKAKTDDKPAEDKKPPPKPPPKKAATKPPPPKTPPKQPDPQPKPAAPRRVVGLSMESTVGGGSGGPTFATGETREGTTDKVAQPKPKKKPPPDAPIGKRSDGPNKKAKNLPTGSVKVVLPKRAKPVVPAYPAALKAQGVEANVPVMVTIDKTGKVTSVKILKSSGHPEFDEAAKKAALAEQFQPATRGGKAIEYTISYTYRFRIEDG